MSEPLWLESRAQYERSWTRFLILHEKLFTSAEMRLLLDGRVVTRHGTGNRAGTSTEFRIERKAVTR